MMSLIRLIGIPITVGFALSGGLVANFCDLDTDFLRTMCCTLFVKSHRQPHKLPSTFPHTLIGQFPASTGTTSLGYPVSRLQAPLQG